jgi:hypothetical protein
MKKALLLAVAAASLCITSAFAQVSVGVPGVGGVTVGDGYRDGYRDRDYRRDYRRTYNRYDRDDAVVIRRERRMRDYDRPRRREVYIERD